jgi:hypothetical protein
MVLSSFKYMKSTTPILNPSDQLGSGFKIIPAIILMFLIMIFIGAQIYLFIETLFTD